MSKLWSIAVVVGLALTGAVVAQGSASADGPLSVCSFQGTLAGNGQAVLAPDERTPVGAIKINENYTLGKPALRLNNVLYWNDDTSGNDQGDWYPVRNVVTGVFYLQKLPVPCGTGM
jgi:hypothetical protein